MLKVNQTPIKQKDHIKYLGAVIDAHLNFKEHIQQLSKKISRGIGILAKLRNYVSLTILKQRNFSLIYPFLIYGATIWGNTYVTTLNSLIVLQKKAIRIITFPQYNDHTSPLFRDLNILKILDVIYYLNCIFMFKFHLNMLPSSFSNFFTLISSRHKDEARLASRSTFCVPSVRTNYGRFNIRFKGAFLWNNLEESLKRLSLCNFKRSLKNDILESY